MRSRTPVRFICSASIVFSCILCLSVLGDSPMLAGAQSDWSSPVVIPDTYAPNFIDLTVDSAAMIHVVYEGSSRVYHQSKQKGELWTTRTSISADPWGLSPDLPYIHVDSADNLHVVWQEAYHPTREGEIWYNGRPAILAAWESAVALSRRDMSRCPAIASDSTGGLHVVGLLDASPDKLLYSVKPSGGAWVGPAEIPGVSSDIYPYIDVAMDLDDTLHVVFPKTGLSYMSKPFGGPWSEPTVISSDFVWYGYPRLGVGTTGTMYLVWGDDTLDSLRYASKPSGGSWTTPVTVPNTTPSGGVDLAVDTAENLHVVWADSDTYEVYYVARQHAEGDWGARQTLTLPDPTRDDIGWPHIAIGPDGILHVIWEDGGEIYYTWAAAPVNEDFWIYLPIVVRW